MSIRLTSYRLLLLFHIIHSSVCQPEVYGSFRFLRSISVVGHGTILVPKTDKIAIFNFFQGAKVQENFPGGDLHNFGILDLVTKSWRPFSFVDGIRVNFACAGYAHDGQGNIMIYGSHSSMYMYAQHYQAVFKYDIQMKKVFQLPNMIKPRWYATPFLLPDGTHHVFSGTVDAGKRRVRQNDSELYDPATGKTKLISLPTDLLNASVGGFYAGMYLLHDGNALVVNNLAVQVIDPYLGVKYSASPPLPPPVDKINIEFPFMGNHVLMPIDSPSGKDPNPQTTYLLILFNGQISEAKPTTNASPYARRIALTVGPGPRQYKWSPWFIDNTGYGRSAGDAVLLPNGRIMLMNGNQQGFGDLVPQGPNMWAPNNEPAPPVLYDIFARGGPRSSPMAPITIARMYHSTAHITRAGAVLVSGCSSCSRFNSSRGVPWSPTGTNEFRTEIYNPPYLHRAGRPVLTFAPTTITYGQVFQIHFTLPPGSPALTSVVLYSTGGTTHGSKFNVRAVKLPWWTQVPFRQGGQAGVSAIMWVTMSPHANWAPPGYYLLFLVSGELYSEGRWVRVVGQPVARPPAPPSPPPSPKPPMPPRTPPSPPPLPKPPMPLRTPPSPKPPMPPRPPPAAIIGKQR